MSKPMAAFESAKNFEFVGYSDQGGKPDGVQIMVERGYAYVAHLFSGGVSVLDVRSPAKPQLVKFLPVHPRSWSIHLQTHGNLLLVVTTRADFESLTRPI